MAGEGRPRDAEWRRASREQNESVIHLWPWINDDGSAVTQN